MKTKGNSSPGQTTAAQQSFVNPAYETSSGIATAAPLQRSNPTYTPATAAQESAYQDVGGIDGNEGGYMDVAQNNMDSDESDEEEI